MTSESSAPIQRRRKQRVAIACEFCRRRKLGCDGKKPTCNKCVAHSRECTYAERLNKERPSNARIIQLMEENAKLRVSLESLQSSLTLEEHQYGLATRISDTQENMPAGPHAQLTASNFPVTKEAKFHGPSSAMYDHVAPSPGRDTTQVSPAHTNQKSQLFAEASRQRQLEAINLRSGKPNFDGVDPEVGSRLLSTFWNRQHCCECVVYRSCFMRDMACQGPYFTPLLLNAMLFVACKHAPSQLRDCSTSDPCTSGMSFRRKAEEILYRSETQVLCKSSITTIQALLLMADALFSWCDERSLSWNYLGIAINMVIDLGLHTGRSEFYRNRSAEDQEVGRRVFWSAYVHDKVQSIYQGRPPRLRDIDCQIPILFLDEYDELEPFNTLTFSATPCQLDSPGHSISTFEQLCKLSIIAESIVATFYAEKSSKTDPLTLLQASVRLHADLEEWRKVLPAHLNLRWDALDGFDVLPHTLSLISMYHALIILLYRPFVSDGHLQSLAASSAGTAFAACATAASEIDAILRLYEKHFCLKTCPYFMSYAAYASGTIHARLAAQKPPGSHSQQMLRHCLEILCKQQEECHAPRQSMKILLMLAKRLKVDVGRGLKASVSRTDEAGNCESSVPLPTGIYQDPLEEESNMAIEGMAGFGTNVGDFDIDAIIRSFDYTSRVSSISEDRTPANPLISGLAEPHDIAASGYDPLDMRSFVDPQRFDFDKPFSVENHDNTLFDPLFGFNASSL